MDFKGAGRALKSQTIDSPRISPVCSRYVPYTRLADRNLRRSGEVKNTYFSLVRKFFLRTVPII